MVLLRTTTYLNVLSIVATLQNLDTKEMAVVKAAGGGHKPFFTRSLLGLGGLGLGLHKFFLTIIVQQCRLPQKGR